MMPRYFFPVIENKGHEPPLAPNHVPETRGG